MDAELNAYSVAIVPVEEGADGEGKLNPLEQGSGTCVRIGGRFFVATAAHLVSKFPSLRYAVLTPSTTNEVLRVRGGGRRGGGLRDEVDVAWLELAPRGAAIAGRHFLDLARLGAYRDGRGEDVSVYGAPTQLGIRGEREGLPSYTAVGRMFPTRAMSRAEVGEVDHARRIHLHWPRIVAGHNDESFEYPEAPGLSGGAIWAMNTDTHGEGWRADLAQLIGIEFAVQRARGYRYLIGQQLQVWLEMVAEDVPELEPIVRAHLVACRTVI